MNVYYYTLYVFGEPYYSNYDPNWCKDFLGVGGDYNYIYGYQYGSTTMDCDSGELYEDLDGTTILWGYYGGTYIDFYGWPIWDTNETAGLFKLAQVTYGTPQYLAFHKNDTGSNVVVDQITPNQLSQNDVNARTQVWFEGTGFTLPAESWDPETGECVVDDVLPTPDNGPGFSWGGGVYEGGGGGPSGKSASVLLVNDMSYDSYGQLNMWSAALEELGFEEDTSGDIGDDMYYKFTNFSYTYAQYFITADLLENTNAIFWSAGSDYYGYFLGSSAERQLLMDWLDETDGAFLQLSADYFSTYYLIGYTGAPNYSPIFMPEYVGISYGSGGGSGYGGTWFNVSPEPGGLLEPIGNFQLHWWQQLNYYSFMNDVTLTNGATPLCYFNDPLMKDIMFHRHDDDDDYDVVYDTRLPSAFSGGGEDTLVSIMEALLDGCGFTLP
jgi:hypothetical protein